MSPLSEVNNRTPRKQPKDVVEPDFFIVGAPRCGTTALSSYLADHPQICFSKPKEPHFFCTDMPAMRYVTEDKDYLACFEHGSHEMTRAAGEGSVWYLYSPAAISNVLCRYPHAKFIIMVRNPLDLIPSFHQKAIESLDEEVRDFETAWHLQSTRRNGLKIPARCRDKKLLDYVWVGRLGVQVQRMFQQVDTAKRRVIVYDDFVSDPLRVYVSVLEFLGIEYDSREDFPPVNANRRIRNLSLHAFARNPPASMVKLVEIAKRIFGFNRLGLLPSLRRKLMVETARPPQSEKLRASMLAEFSADIDLLGALIQRDLSHWKR